MKLITDDLDHEKYEVSKTLPSFESKPKSVQFTITCSDRKACGLLKSRIEGNLGNKNSETKDAQESSTASGSSDKTTSSRSPSAASGVNAFDEKKLNFQVEFRNVSAARSSIVAVSVGEHVAQAPVYRKLLSAFEGRGLQAYMTSSDVDKLAEEVAESVLAAHLPKGDK